MASRSLRIRTQPLNRSRELALVHTGEEAQPFRVTYWDRKKGKPEPAAPGAGFPDLARAIREFERRVRIAYLQGFEAA
jgi:hypothetical protein